MNNNANIKQFQLIKFLNENVNDDHVISRISIVLRRDKLEAPYYMNTKIRLSSCLDNEENGLIHAMNILNHSRMYNLTEEKYNEIKSLIIDTFECNESDQVEFTKNDKQIKIAIMSKNDTEFKNLFESYHELFGKIDNLID
ncbi:MAG: hypothetical protein IJI80_04960 [Methanobrevibacter sp.]|uniref:hypothetical protein n=1 Tax=Methanobrevibacter sp. TaxID=66852 RepID=UPI002600F270|nr:hypothetical protein [Methanobrevibacter sp.]MBQ6139008.1 hypothetical protein [Methanobrevibacter sp.]